MDTNIYYNAIYKNFRKLYVEKGISFKEISAQTGIVIWDLLVVFNVMPATDISLDCFFKLCEFFDVSPLDMLK
ncbi:MAG: hypothetical protein E7532_00290 [Ruminococcaceae bacterium]|nr:hypothetical protein [Oscillospiraceae bacterium]